MYGNYPREEEERRAFQKKDWKSAGLRKLWRGSAGRSPVNLALGE